MSLSGVGSNNLVKRVKDLGITPWMGCFHVTVEKGYGFLQFFKTISEGLSDTRKIQVYSDLLEDEALLWFLGTKFGSWLDIKQEFIKTWCVVMKAKNEIVDVEKVFKKENGKI